MQDQINELIFSGEDRFGKVEVYDTPTLRNLHLGTPIIQSSMFHHDPYALEMEYNRVMMLPLTWMDAPKNGLFLGLGGGSKAKFLWRYFPTTYCHAVELSPLVIETSRKYFHLPDDQRFTIECSSAEAYLERKKTEPFDLIFVDLYLGDGMAPITQNFFAKCKEHLSGNGTIVWNLWRSTSKVFMKAAFKEFESLFQEFHIFTVKESPNLILVGKGKTTFSQKRIEERRVELTRLTGLDF